MSDETDKNGIVFRPGGRERMRSTAEGRVLHYAYADEDYRTPAGMRRVTFLEPDPYYTETPND